MTDDHQRARELLAQEYERRGLPQSAQDIRGNRMDEHLGWVREANMALAAITAALRAAPEGFVMVPVEATENAIEAICMAHGHGVWPEGYGKGARALRRAAASNGYRAALDARPQGVKDA